jgi:hypothetical protein
MAGSNTTGRVLLEKSAPFFQFPLFPLPTGEWKNWNLEKTFGAIPEIPEMDFLEFLEFLENQGAASPEAMKCRLASSTAPLLRSSLR